MIGYSAKYPNFSGFPRNPPRGRPPYSAAGGRVWFRPKKFRPHTWKQPPPERVTPADVRTCTRLYPQPARIRQGPKLFFFFNQGNEGATSSILLCVIPFFSPFPSSPSVSNTFPLLAS